MASGLANIVSPNIWRLPIAQLETSERTDVKLAASTLLLPHWGGLARCGAGVVCLAIAAWQVGLGPASIGLVPLVLALAWSIVAISAVLARAGVARPELDVVQFVVRWRRRENELTPISMGAAVLQFGLSIMTLPAVKLLPPSVLYQPELGPSRNALLVVLGLSVALLVARAVVWAGRIDCTHRQSSNGKPRRVPEPRGRRVAPTAKLPIRPHRANLTTSPLLWITTRQSFWSVTARDEGGTPWRVWRVTSWQAL